MALIDENSLDDHTVATSPLELEDQEEKEVQQQEVQQQQQEEEIPDKYKGKTAAEIIKMHQEAEKLIGKQGSEVGELRKVVDDFIKSQTPSKKHQEVQEEDDTDFFADPVKAVDKRVENHPAVREAREASTAMRRAEVANRIKADYPDLDEIVTDTSFQEWVKGSKVRLELYARADSQFDYDAAIELLGTWKERKEATRKVAETATSDRKQQLKAASNFSQGSNEAPAKKIYRRSDIITLMQTNPDKYEALYPEIEAAYREGRVK